MNISMFTEGGADNIILIVAIVALALGLIAAIIAVIITVKNGQRVPRQKKEKEETLVTADEYLEEMEVRGDSLVLARNVIYSVGEDGQIGAGKYRIKSAVEGEESFNIRFNGLVREFADGTEIVLGAGDTVCAVSHSVLLEKR
ncbi:MAG: hypothetical protein NC350_01405 [Corallococcus sp.]|nr:hypothetical protein [Corallococcus sp.]